MVESVLQTFENQSVYNAFGTDWVQLTHLGLPLPSPLIIGSVEKPLRVCIAQMQ